MKTNQTNPKAEQVEPLVMIPEDVQLTYKYPKPGNHVARGESSNVLSDFFEFTDYLTPCSHNIMKCSQARQVGVEDYYSGLLSL